MHTIVDSYVYVGNTSAFLVFVALILPPFIVDIQSIGSSSLSPKVNILATNDNRSHASSCKVSRCFLLDIIYLLF